jgi:hypothetical protein
MGIIGFTALSRISQARYGLRFASHVVTRSVGGGQRKPQDRRGRRARGVGYAAPHTLGFSVYR